MTNRFFRLSAIFVLTLAALLIISAPVAQASALFGYDQTLGGNPNNPNGTGWVNGTGPVDGAFSTITSIYNVDPSESYFGFVRFSINTVGPITPSVENQYNQPPGAVINVDYGVLLTGLTLTNFNITLTIDDTTTGKSLSYNPVGGDDTYINADGSKTVGPVANPGAESGFEQSERLTFAFIQSVLGYSIGDGILLTETGIPVNLNMADPTTNANLNAAVSTPEPATYAFIGFGLVGLGLLHRRKRFAKK
jgi:hypothetical protein